MKTLRPFLASPMTSAIKVSAQTYVMSDTHLLVEFYFEGEANRILWPAANPNPVRKDELWKTTCLEVFLSGDSSPQSPYLEINCSPNGDWAAYSFSSYRHGMTPAKDLHVHLTERKSDDDGIQFRFEITSSTSLPFNVIGLTSVIEFSNHEKSYWSLKHPAAQADFHDKKGWE